MKRVFLLFCLTFLFLSVMPNVNATTVESLEIGTGVVNKFNTSGYNVSLCTVAADYVLLYPWGSFDARGQLPATYSFTYDVYGEDPVGWTVSEPAGVTIQVDDDYDAHRWVVLLFDNSGSNAGYFYNDFTATRTGTIEFYIESSNTTKTCSFSLKRGSVNLALITINNWNFRWSGLTLRNASSNCWYHVQVDWVETGWQIAINQQYFGAPYTFPFLIDISTGVSRFQISSDAASYPITVSLDAVDYSWDPTYFENRIINITSGYYISKVYDLGNTSLGGNELVFYRDFTNFDFIASWSVQYRYSYDGYVWSVWSSEIVNTHTNLLSLNLGRYFQFRINLRNTVDPINVYYFKLSYNKAGYVIPPTFSESIIMFLGFIVPFIALFVPTFGITAALGKRGNKLFLPLLAIMAGILTFTGILTPLVFIFIAIACIIFVLKVKKQGGEGE